MNPNELMGSTRCKPLLLGDWPDIAVCRIGGDYYLTHSSGMWRPAALIWHSRDLHTWRPLVHAVRNHPGCVWVTDLLQDGDICRLFFLSTFQMGGGFVVEAPGMAGPWSDPKPTGLPPDLVIGRDDDGTRYAFTGQGFVQRLRGETLTAEEEPVKSYQGWDYSEDWAAEAYPCLEAPKIMKKDGWWYLLEAQGGTFGPSTSHMVIAARSRSPYGPWENSPFNPLIRTWSRQEEWWSKGHGELVEGPDGQWHCILHGILNGYRSLGRGTVMEPIEWTADGWFRVKQKTPDEYFSPAKIVMQGSDRFSDKSHGLSWQFWEHCDIARYQASDGQILLEGLGDSPGSSRPLSMPAMHKAYEVETELEIEENAEAGLLLFAKPDMYLGMSLGPDGTLRRVQEQYRRYERNLDPHVATRRIGLRIVNEHQDARFYYKLEGAEWQIIQPSMEVSFGQSLWVTLRPALFCCGDGRARFHSFTYRVLE